MDLLDFGGALPVLLLFASMGVRSSPSTAATMRSLRAREDMPGAPRSRLVGGWANLKAALPVYFFPLLYAVPAGCLGVCVYL